MASTMLDCFPQLLRDNTNDRLDGALKLLQHLSKVQDDEESKELNHVLKRLVRGLGSSKISSRKGFYSTLTVYLSLNTNINVDKIFTIMDQELKMSDSSSKSDFANINNGRILACGALIRSKILKNSSIEEQKRVFECLIHSGKQRSYLGLESVSFIVEFLNQLEDKNSLTPIWPILEPEICKPFSEQNKDSFYTLLVIQKKFPEFMKKKLKKHYGNENIINEESIKDILKILTDLPRIICYKHPVFKIFCEKLVETEYVEQFWTGIDQRFIKPSKTDEYLGVELFTLLLDTINNKTLISSLLSPNFLKYILRKLSFNTNHKTDDIAIAFKNALTQLAKVLDKNVKTKIHISVLKKLILYPGDLMIEKITGTKVIQMITSNLNTDGVRKLANLYKEIAANTKFKEKPNSVTEPWTNGERTYAMQLLGTKLLNHPEIISDQEWRIEQLKFIFNLGLCEVSNVGVELVPHFKESFYRSLDHKLPKLDDLRSVLSSLIDHIDKSIIQNSEIKLRTPLDESSSEAWKKMLKLIQKVEKDSKSNENIKAVFHTMNLHMGLQIFSDPEMAVSAIDELHSCYEHLKAKQKLKKKNNSVVSDEEELEWVEVVVDLLLSLLSRKDHLLRSLVGCVFPHICPHLTPSAIHQILNILDVKSGKNPLSTSKDGEESDSELESNNEDEEDDEENSEDENEENGIEEESDSALEESDIDDETVTDRVRLAVRQALGDVAMQTDDEDIDVDNINEEEGKRLDESLAAAFRILKENRKSKSKKQEKSAEALTHFRIRVIDLLEIYLETSPSMALALDMLVPLFALLEFSIMDPHQRPLENRVRSCLKKLSAVKKFKSIEDVDEELLTTVLKTLIEKGERSAAVCLEMGDKLAECCVFLVRCSQQTNVPTDSFIQILGENLTAFFKKRDCILPQVLFKSLLQLCWVGNWHLAPLLVNFAFDDSIRSYRRGQALEFLRIFYNNTRMIMADDYKDKRLKMEKNLCKSSINVLTELSSAHGIENGKLTTNVKKEIKQKYVCFLLSLLLAVYAHHIPEAWDWKKVGESIAKYRSNVSLSKDAKRAYNKLANRIGAPVISKVQPQIENNSHSNGNQHLGSESEKEISDNEILNNSQSSTSIQNGISVETKKVKKVKTKRPNTNTLDLPNKKKKNVQSGD